MKACIHESYGGPDVLQIEDVPKPAPGDDEILIPFEQVVDAFRYVATGHKRGNVVITLEHDA